MAKKGKRTKPAAKRARKAAARPAAKPVEKPVEEVMEETEEAVEEPSSFEAPDKELVPKPELHENDVRQELESEEMPEGDEPKGDLDFEQKRKGPRLR